MNGRATLLLPLLSSASQAPSHWKSGPCLHSPLHTRVPLAPGRCGQMSAGILRVKQKPPPCAVKSHSRGWQAPSKSFPLQGPEPACVSPAVGDPGAPILLFSIPPTEGPRSQIRPLLGKNSEGGPQQATVRSHHPTAGATPGKIQGWAARSLKARGCLGRKGMDSTCPACHKLSGSQVPTARLPGPSQGDPPSQGEHPKQHSTPGRPGPEEEAWKTV